MDRFTNGQISRRELLQGGLGWGVLALASQAVAAETGSGGLSVQSLIRQENEKAGTRDWMLKKTGVDPATKYRCPWIEGFRRFWTFSSSLACCSPRRPSTTGLNKPSNSNRHNWS
ncbi:MAG: hypothetical protein NTY19_21040 [Planctomycetota bacterium]|nr:hypothetical protein [Planctomycetota bacterium]